MFNYDYDKKHKSLEGLLATYAGEKMGKHSSIKDEGTLTRNDGTTYHKVTFTKSYTGLQRIGRFFEGLALTFCSLFTGLADQRVRHKFDAALTGKVNKIVICDESLFQEASKILSPQNNQELDVSPKIESTNLTDLSPGYNLIFQAEDLLKNLGPNDVISILDNKIPQNLSPALKSLALSLLGEAKRQKSANTYDKDAKKELILAATRTLHEALRLDPQNAFANARLGACYSQLNSLDPKDRGAAHKQSSAKKYLEEALAINPEDPFAHAQLGAVLRGIDDKEANKHIQKALSLVENDLKNSNITPETKLILVDFLINPPSGTDLKPSPEQSNFKKADTLMSSVKTDIGRIKNDNFQASRLHSELAKIYSSHGVANLNETTKNWETEGETACKEAIRLNENNVDAHIAFSQYYLYKGDAEKAQIQIVEALKIDPNNKDASVLQLYITYNQSRSELDKCNWLEALIKVQPESDAALATLGEIYLKRRDEHTKMEGKKYLQRAININPNNRIALEYGFKPVVYLDIVNAVNLLKDNLMSK